MALYWFNACMQVGVVEVGRPFPFWVRGQALLTLQVATASPASVVRLTRGAEVAVAPRPRVRPQLASLPSGALADAARSNGTAATAAPCAWLRLQVRHTTLCVCPYSTVEYLNLVAPR